MYILPYIVSEGCLAGAKDMQYMKIYNLNRFRLYDREEDRRAKVCFNRILIMYKVYPPVDVNRDYMIEELGKLLDFIPRQLSPSTN
jgi:hypothetical protein